MNFGILVNEGPYTHEASDSAYQFCRAALAAGFRISGLGQLIESSIQADRMVTFGD